MLGSLGQDLCASAFNFAAPCPFLTLADAGAEHRPHAGCSPRAATGLWPRPDPTAVLLLFLGVRPRAGGGGRRGPGAGSNARGRC